MVRGKIIIFFMDINTVFEKVIYDVISKYPSDTVFLAAVSGGADSMAMLAALYSLTNPAHDSRFSALNYRFSVLHVEHGLRPSPESNGDADFVRAFCDQRGIKCRVKHISQGKISSYAQRKGIGIEAAARHFRHKALRANAELLGENVCILIAHTKDDALELALMRVLRGCGPAGLAAMPQASGSENKEQLTMNRKRRITGCSIVRPLLSLSRSEVIAYLKAKNISWREDATNTDEKFLRNKIRRRLTPLLDEAFPAWRTGVWAMAQTQSLASEFIAQEAKSRVIWKEFLSTPDSRLPTPHLSTNAENFFSQPLVIREEAVFLAIDKLLEKTRAVFSAQTQRTVKRAVVRKFCARCLNCEGSMKAVDLGAVTVRHEKNMIVISRKEREFFERGVSRLI